MPAAYLKAPGYSGRFRHFCRKVGYPSRAAAQRALKTQKLAGGNALRIYRCPLCPGEVWHHGHNRDKATNAFFKKIELAQCNGLDGR